MAESATHGGQDVINVIFGAEIQTFEPPLAPQIGASYMPMVMMSNWPPLVVMSVVTRLRSVFLSRVTHLTVMPGFAASKSGLKAYISIIWPLLMVAIVNSPETAADAPVMHSARPNAVLRSDFMLSSLKS
jgi:hypothetical protein